MALIINRFLQLEQAMIVVLMGYMGVGKTSVGKRLAEKIKYRFLDLDAYISINENQSITDIFKTKGELIFRKKESQYLSEIINSENNTVLSLGGGTPCYSDNLNVLKASGHVKTFHLKLPISHLVERLYTEKNHRPVIAHITSEKDLIEFIGKHLFERNAYYNQADYTISCEGKSVDEIADAIIQRLI